MLQQTASDTSLPAASFDHATERDLAFDARPGLMSACESESAPGLNRVVPTHDPETPDHEELTGRAASANALPQKPLSVEQHVIRWVLIDAVVITVNLQQQVALLEDASGRLYVINEDTPGVDVMTLKPGKNVCCSVSDNGLVERAVAGLSLVQGVSVAKLGGIGAAAAREADVRHYAAGRATTTAGDEPARPCTRGVIGGVDE